MFRSYLVRILALFAAVIALSGPHVAAQSQAQETFHYKVNFVDSETETPSTLKEFTLTDACSGKLLFRKEQKSSRFLKKADWKKGEIVLMLEPGAYHLGVRSSKGSGEQLLLEVDGQALNWERNSIFHLLPESWRLRMRAVTEGQPKTVSESYLVRFYDQETNQPVHLEDFALVDACAKQLVFRKGFFEPPDVAKPNWETGQVTLLVPAGVFLLYVEGRDYEPLSTTIDIRYGPDMGREMGMGMIRVSKQGEIWTVLRPDAGVIAGRVFDAETGTPLEGATIRHISGNQVTTTDRFGEFRLVVNLLRTDRAGTIAMVQISVEVARSFYQGASASFALAPGGYRFHNFRLARIKSASPSP